MYLGFGWGYSEHTYSLAASGLRIKDSAYTSREAAKQSMYKLLAKHGLAIKEVYDDKHNKTYICNNNVRFYINRF